MTPLSPKNPNISLQKEATAMNFAVASFYHLMA